MLEFTPQEKKIHELKLEIKRLKSENENLSEVLAETWEELRVLKLERNYFPCLTNRDK